MIEPAIGVNPVMPGWPGFISANPNGFLSRITGPTSEPLTTAEVKSHLRLDSSSAEPAPTAPTVALAGAGAGNCENGAHRVACTFVTADGETELGALSAAVTVANKTADGKIAVSNIPVGGSAVTTVKLYMPLVGTTTPCYYAGSVSNGTTTATINLADSGLGAQAPSTNTTADPYLSTLIQTAREWVERECERALLTQTWELWLDSFPWWRAPILLSLPPIQSITSIKYYDQDLTQQTWASSNYLVMAPAGPAAQRAQIVPNAGVSWPLLPSFALTQRRPDQVQVRFVTGWTAKSEVPGAIKQAMLLLIGNWYRNREAAQITRASADTLPYGVEQLLAPYKVMVY